MHRTLAWLLSAVTLILVGLAIVLGFVNSLALDRFFAEYLISLALGAVAFATVGALIVVRQPANSIGWFYCALGVGFGASSLLQQYARYALLTAAGSVPWADLVGWLNLWTGVPWLLSVVLILPLLFPDGRLPSPRWRPALWLAIVALTLFTATWALSPGPIDASQPNVPNPIRPANADQILSILAPLAYALTLAAVACAIAAVVTRLRRADAVGRRQLAWFAYGAGVMLASLLIPILLGIFVFNDFPGDTLLSGVLVCIGFPAVPVATGIAILRHRLFDIDRLFNRTLVYAALTACILVVYALVVGYLSTLFHAQGNVLISLVATAIVAIAFQPLRERLQRGVDRMLYGDRDAPYKALTRLGERLQATLEPHDVFDSIVSTLHHAFALDYTALDLERDGDFLRVAARGEPAAREVRVPLAYQGQPVGRLILAGDVDTDALATFATQAGAAVHAVRLTDQLQRAREQLVLAREEERRRLRHDLHDELAPTLAGLTLTAGTVRQLLDEHRAQPASALAGDPSLRSTPREAEQDDVQASGSFETARSLLVGLQASLRASVGQVRQLARDLRPPVLDELGLLAAVRERARQFDADLQVTVDAPDTLPPLPAAVEVAAYRICSEALLNVVRHAHAQRCAIALDVCAPDGARRLRLSVTDDGAGLAPTDHPGVGLSSMRERAAELGGTCAIGPAPDGGTRVLVELPLT